MMVHNSVSYPRYDFKFQRVDRGYPKAISISWPGVTEKIDAAVSLRNGTILLFNGNRSFTFHPPLCKDKAAFFDVSSDFRSTSCVTFHFHLFYKRMSIQLHFVHVVELSNVHKSKGTFNP